MDKAGEIGPMKVFDRLKEHEPSATEMCWKRVDCRCCRGAEMRRTICLSAVALCLAAFSVPEAIAQHCEPYWTAAYKCMNGCGCPGGGAAPPQPTGPSPEVLALQRARARMVAVIEAMSDSLPFFDRNSWMADLPNTPEQFITDADLLHVTLVAQSSAFQRQVAAYRTIIDLGNRAAPALMQQLPAAQRDIARLDVKLKEAQGYLPWYQAQTDNIQKASRQMRAQSARFLAAIKADQQAAVAAFMVLLPTGAASMSDDNPIVEPGEQYKSRVPTDPVVALYANGRPLYANLPVPLMVALPDTNTQPDHAGVPPLSGSLDDRAGNLEKDAQNIRASFELRNQMMAQAQPAQQAYQNAGSTLAQAVSQQNILVGQIFQAAAIAEKARSIELAASDAMYTEEARFFANAAQSWIWANTKKFVLNEIKVELKMQDYFKRHTDVARSPFLDIDEAHVLQYYQQRKFNIMNLPDGIDQAIGLKKLRDSVVTLQTHAQGYALEAAAIAARGTEAEAQAFAADMYQGMDEDSKSIVKTNMGLMNLPEPFASVATHYFTKTDQ
jgi:hypothetical protein